MKIDLEQLAKFLVKAKVQTYASDGKEIEPQRPGFKELEFKEEDWEYRDSYAGFFFAPCFPTIVGVTYSKHPENFGSVFGIIFAVGLFGGVIIPKTIGNMAKGSSIQKSLKLLIPICVALIVLAVILGRIGSGVQ